MDTGPHSTYRTQPRKRMWANRSKTLWRRHGQHLSSSGQLQSQRASREGVACRGGLVRGVPMERATERQHQAPSRRTPLPRGKAKRHQCKVWLIRPAAKSKACRGRARAVQAGVAHCTLALPKVAVKCVFPKQYQWQSMFNNKRKQGAVASQAIGRSWTLFCK